VRLSAPTSAEVEAGPTLTSGAGFDAAANANALLDANLVDLSNPLNVEFLRQQGIEPLEAARRSGTSSPSGTVQGFARGGVTNSSVAIVGDSTDGRPNPEAVVDIPGFGFAVAPVEDRGSRGFDIGDVRRGFAAAPTFRGLSTTSPTDIANSTTPPGLGVAARRRSLSASAPSDVERAVRDRFLPGIQGRREPQIPRAQDGGLFSSFNDLLPGAIGGFTGFTQPDVTQGQLQGFARETLFPNVRRVFGGGFARPDSFGFAVPTLRGLSRLSQDDIENADTALRLGALGGKPTTFADVARAAANRFLPAPTRGRARVQGFGF
jgi:hypothetical protein